MKPTTVLTFLALLALSGWCGTGVSPAAERGADRTFTVQDMLACKRISDIQVSPDGKNIAFSVTTADLEKNSLSSHIWILEVFGDEPRQFTSHEKGESSPAWSPDSTRIAFVSSRGGSPQVWTISIAGGEARQVTSISTGASAPKWRPLATHIAFLSDVFPGLEGGDPAQKKKQEEIDSSGIQAQVIDHLFYRQWNSYRKGKRTHLFMSSVQGGEAVDLSPGDSDVIGGREGFDFSPDGKEIAYTRGPVSPETGSSANSEAWSTNADIVVRPVDGGKAICLTAGNKGWDGSPLWSPDGRYIAFRSQARDGYEADRFRVAVVERATGKVNHDLAPSLDRSADQILWAPDGDRIFVSVEEEGRSAIYEISFSGLDAPESFRSLFSSVQVTGLSMPRSGKFLIGGIQSLTRSTEVGILSLTGSLTEAYPREPFPALTHLNDDLFSRKDMPRVQSVRYPGARGKAIQAWILTPPGHVPGNSYPFLLFIHGGPQGAWQDIFHYRWNPAIFASRGFVAMLPNPHGSTGFGQELTEQISGDWGGACYEDLMKAVDWAVSKGLADPGRLGALGGSYGGYMVNWMLGHTDRFKALASHAGVYNLESMYGSTEELWFPEWDLGGTPWKNKGAYDKYSPHRFAANFKTPTLVIHGELDFRVPVTEALQLFTALRRQGVEARFLYFPDEGHWVSKPKNSKLWNETVLEWFEKHLAPSPAKEK